MGTSLPDENLSPVTQATTASHSSSSSLPFVILGAVFGVVVVVLGSFSVFRYPTTGRRVDENKSSTGTGSKTAEVIEVPTLLATSHGEESNSDINKANEP